MNKWLIESVSVVASVGDFNHSADVYTTVELYAGGTADDFIELTSDELEKAKKDITKLVRTVITDKRGRRKTVYVLPAEVHSGEHPTQAHAEAVSTYKHKIKYMSKRDAYEHITRRFGSSHAQYAKEYHESGKQSKQAGLFGGLIKPIEEDWLTGSKEPVFDTSKVFGQKYHPQIPEQVLETIHNKPDASKLSKETVDISDLIPTQPYVKKGAIENKLSGKSTATDIIVARDEVGALWIVDGHHTIAAAISRGDKQISVAIVEAEADVYADTMKRINDASSYAINKSVQSSLSSKKKARTRREAILFESIAEAMSKDQSTYDSYTKAIMSGMKDIKRRFEAGEVDKKSYVDTMEQYSKLAGTHIGNVRASVDKKALAIDNLSNMSRGNYSSASKYVSARIDTYSLYVSKSISLEELGALMEVEQTFEPEKMRYSLSGEAIGYKKQISRALLFLSSIVEARSGHTLEATIFKSSSPLRASYNHGSRLVTIGKGDEMSTLLHELGHGIEDSDIDHQRLCRKYIADNTKRATIRGELRLKTSTNSNGEEIFDMDKKSVPSSYCGRKYVGGRATEITAMFFTEFIGKPKTFKDKYPEYFDLIVNSLQRNKDAE